METEKDQQAQEAEARMYAPLDWDSPASCRIEDLTEPRFDEALRLIKVPP